MMLWFLSRVAWDWERANCKRAGRAGHSLCGWCRHGLPMLMCMNAGGQCWILGDRKAKP